MSKVLKHIHNEIERIIKGVISVNARIKSLLFLGSLSLTMVFGACSEQQNKAAGKDNVQEREATIVPAKEIKTGETYTITLDENITTGYSWVYNIEDEEIIQLESEDDQSEGVKTAIGAGNQHTWTFKGLKKGTAKIIFKYYRGWEDEDSAIQTIEYTVKVN